jgi:hypothetical protein
LDDMEMEESVETSEGKEEKAGYEEMEEGEREPEERAPVDLNLVQ